MKIEVQCNGKDLLTYPCKPFLAFDDAVNITKEIVANTRKDYPNDQFRGRVVASRKVSAWV